MGGSSDDAPVDLRAAARDVMLANGFQPDFPPEVQLEVAQLDDQDADDAARKVRKDLTTLLWSSIDNRESRDLDQVEYAERLPGGEIRLMVGIADVDALVPKGSAVDLHAAENTTSVYTGVVVFPMLPERLSTNLTSLNEGEDRCAIVVELDVREDGSIARENAYRALVRNHAKLAYEPVGHWLSGTGARPKKMASVEGLEDQVRLHDEVSQRLAAYRRRAGAVEIETIEARPVTAGEKVIDIAVSPRNRARDLIESFMVAVNGAMARILERKHVPAIRRVVREPRQWKRIVALAAEMGETLPAEPNGAALSEFLARRRAAEPREFADLSLTVVKLLGPGEYVLERRFSRREDQDHFGLGAPEYLHSTAPNRRFPDLVTQRLLKDADGKGGSPYSDDELSAIARHCTLQEDKARRVERSMRKKIAAVLMADRVGSSFVATVTGASSKGTYVRVLSPPVEGRVVRGERGLEVGDTVRVTLTAVDAERGFIDFVHEGEDADVARKRERTSRKRAAAARLERRIGETFEAVVTSASPKGTYVRLADGSAEGRIMRGYQGLQAGERVSVTLIGTNAVHGFIDFEYTARVDRRKVDRTARKQAQAKELLERIGETFDAVVTGVKDKATYVQLENPPSEGRLVRGWKGLVPGDSVRVVLLAADPEKGWIDFARS
jgi:exoribonuclease-2